MNKALSFLLALVLALSCASALVAEIVFVTPADVIGVWKMGSITVEESGVDSASLGHRDKSWS